MLNYKRLLVVLFLFILSCLTIVYYFYMNVNYKAESLDVTLSKIIMILCFNLLFYSLILLLNINHYRRIFLFVLIVIATLWLFELIAWAYFQITPISHQFGMFWETVILISFSLIGQGLIIYILYMRSTSQEQR